MSHLENDRLKEQIHEAKQEDTMHTPTPWKRDGDLVTDSGELIIAKVNTDANSIVDAKFIVTAVNAHEDLVRSLDSIEKDRDRILEVKMSLDFKIGLLIKALEHCIKGYEEEGAKYGVQSDALRHAKQALAKAGVKV